MTNQNDTLASMAAAIATTLQRTGATHATVEYSGSGDSGGQFTVKVYKAKGQDNDELAENIVKNANVFLPDTVGETSLDTALESLCDQAISAFGHDGYENNEGGYGTLTIDAEDGTLELEHSDYVIDTSDSSHGIKFQAPSPKAPETPSALRPNPPTEFVPVVLP